MTGRARALSLCAWLAVPCAASAEVAAPETTEVFTGTEATRTEVVHALAHRFLLVGTEVVSRGGRPLEAEVGYRLDPDAGTVQLADPLSEGE